MYWNMYIYVYKSVINGNTFCQLHVFFIIWNTFSSLFNLDNGVMQLCGQLFFIWGLEVSTSKEFLLKTLANKIL
jgi:hypothetical protein